MPKSAGIPEVALLFDDLMIVREVRQRMVEDRGQRLDFDELASLLGFNPDAFRGA